MAGKSLIYFKYEVWPICRFIMLPGENRGWSECHTHSILWFPGPGWICTTFTIYILYDRSYAPSHDDRYNVITSRRWQKNRDLPVRCMMAPQMWQGTHFIYVGTSILAFFSRPVLARKAAAKLLLLLLYTRHTIASGPKHPYNGCLPRVILL